MLRPILLPLIAASAGLATAAETHDGITYEVRWEPNGPVEPAPIKLAYEAAAAQQATSRLRDALTATGIAPECLAAASSSTGSSTPADLYALKDCIVEAASGEESVFFDLLSDDIHAANTLWDKIIAESTPDSREAWIPARASVRALFDGGLTATEFAAWTMSPYADAANLHANPEHYFKEAVMTSAESQTASILEGWGGVLSPRFGMVRTNFTVPEYTVPEFGSAEYPLEWAIGPSFNPLLQRIGPKDLSTGSQATFGVLHIAVRDVAATEQGNDTGKSGIEVYAAVWYPPWDLGVEADKVEFREKYLADESHHMVVEIVNLTLQARKDCRGGGVSCVVPQ